MELAAARYADWEACIRGVPVSEYGHLIASGATTLTSATDSA